MGHTVERTLWDAEQQLANLARYDKISTTKYSLISE